MISDLTFAGLSAETGLVGSLLLDNTYIAPVSEIVTPQDLVDKHTARVFAKVLDLWAEGVSNIDAAAVASVLPSGLELVPHDCAGNVGSAVNAVRYAEKVKAASIRRDIVKQCRAVEAMAKEDDRPVAEVLGDAQMKISGVSVREDDVPLTEVVTRVLKEAEDAARAKKPSIGLPTGFSLIDNVVNMGPGKLPVIGGRQSSGKTAFGWNLADNFLKHGHPGAFFSQEMEEDELVARAISGEADIDCNRIVRGDLSPHEWTAVTEAAARVNDRINEHLLLDCTPAVSCGYIFSRCKHRQSRKGLEWVLIDYLQLMKYEPGDTKTQRVGDTAKELKIMARRLKVPVILLTQLKQDAEGREPTAGDMSWSDDILSHADSVLLVHRPSRESDNGVIILAKNRGGPLGKVFVHFRPSTCVFSERT